MTDYAKNLAKNASKMSESQQQQASKAIAGTMDPTQKEFMMHLIELIESGAITVSNPQTFIKDEVYETLSEEWKDKTDLALMNIAEQVKIIDEFYHSKATPNESPHLQTMVEQLWQMKERIEQHHDVFKF